MRTGIALLVALTATACIFDQSTYEGGGRSDNGARKGGPDTTATATDTATTPTPTATDDEDDAGALPDTGLLPDTSTGDTDAA